MINKELEELGSFLFPKTTRKIKRDVKKAKQVGNAFVNVINYLAEEPKKK